jgi:MFS family permease
MYAIAAVAAPLLGGAFTTKLTWRWCFYINLPLGGTALVAIALFFHPRPNVKASSSTWREKVGQMDLLGTAILIPGVICLLIALQWGGSEYQWSSTRTIILLVATAMMIAGFIIIQIWKEDKATVPPRIIKQRSVAYSVCYVFHAGGAVNVFEYYVSTSLLHLIMTVS